MKLIKNISLFIALSNWYRYICIQQMKLMEEMRLLLNENKLNQSNQSNQTCQDLQMDAFFSWNYCRVKQTSF